VVTTDYIANGGDGYLPLSQGAERVNLFAANSTKEFNGEGRRQLVVAQYLKSIGVYTQPELPASEDLGNQNLSKRADSVLAPVVRRIESLQQSTRLTFRTLPGRRYVAESMEMLGGAWVRLPQEAQGTGALGELVDSRPPSKERYYRILMVP
jgi:hypothetical protein